MRLLWTKSHSLGPIICWAMNEPVSHFAIQFHNSIILHSNFKGVHVSHIDDFKKTCDVIYSKEWIEEFDIEAALLSKIMDQYYGKKYDFRWFFKLSAAALISKIFRKPIPDDIKSRSRDKFLCTECIEFIVPVIGPIDIGNGSPFLLAKRLGVVK